MDSYEQLDIIGRGCYGTAVLVRHRSDAEQLRVLKEVDLSRLPASGRNEAQSEVDVLKSLQHNNIIAYHTTFVEAGKLYIVMEFADAGTLSKVISHRCTQVQRYSEHEALLIFSQLCLALQHIHAKNIMHRDLKSENVFLTKDGTVKLGDFGIAKVLEHTAEKAVTMIGTPSYLAPEVCDSKPYGKKADIWSLGVILFEVLMLELPFKAASLAALVVKIVTGKPKAVDQELYSKELCSLSKNLLRKHPEKRLSADEILSVPVVSRKAQVFGWSSSTTSLTLENHSSSRRPSKNGDIGRSRSSSRNSKSSSRSSSCSIQQPLHDENAAPANTDMNANARPPTISLPVGLQEREHVLESSMDRCCTNRRCRSQLCREENITWSARQLSQGWKPRSKSQIKGRMELPRLDVRMPGGFDKTSGVDYGNSNPVPPPSAFPVPPPTALQQVLAAELLEMQPCLQHQLPRMPQAGDHRDKRAERRTSSAPLAPLCLDTTGQRSSSRPSSRKCQQRCQVRSRVRAVGDLISRSRSRPPVNLECGTP